jgi:hypothetical protein
MGRRKEGPPSTLRRAYGPKEALSSGLTGFSTQPRAASSINRDVEMQVMQRQIAELARDYPMLKERFAEIARRWNGTQSTQSRYYEVVYEEMWLEVRRSPYFWTRRRRPQSN